MNVTYFSTKTCMPCKTLYPQVEQICTTKGVPLKHVDIEENLNLAPQWLTSVPTMVVRHSDGYEQVLMGPFATATSLRKALRRDE